MVTSLPRRRRISSSDRASRSTVVVVAPAIVVCLSFRSVAEESTVVLALAVNRILPETLAWAGSSRIAASAVADLPEPDSPTTPSVWPAAISNDIPCTASRPPNPIDRSSTRRMGGLSAPCAAPLPEEDVVFTLSMVVHLSQFHGHEPGLQARRRPLKILWDETLGIVFASNLSRNRA